MTPKNKLPKVLEPSSLVELSSTFYHSIYKSNDVSKKQLDEINNYISKSLNDNEKAYMYTLLSTAEHLAKKTKEINIRYMTRERYADTDRQNCLEEVENFYNIDLEKAGEIRDNDLNKVSRRTDIELEKIQTKEKGWKKILKSVPTAVSTFLIVVHCSSR